MILLYVFCGLLGAAISLIHIWHVEAEQAERDEQWKRDFERFLKELP